MDRYLIDKEPGDLTADEIIVIEREIRNFVKCWGTKTGFRKGISQADKTYCQGLLAKLNDATGHIRDLGNPTWCEEILPIKHPLND